MLECKCQIAFSVVHTIYNKTPERKIKMEKLRDIGFVIIADDNEFKRKTIHEYMEKLYPKAEFAESASVNSTLRFLCCTLPDKKNTS